MNLHGIVKSAIGVVNPHETVTIYKNAGTQNIKGKIVNVYEAITATAQLQQPTAADVRQFDKLQTAEKRLKAYIETPADVADRLKQSSGDFIRRADGTLWKIVGVIDLFPDWRCVACVLQVEGVDGIVDGQS